MSSLADKQKIRINRDVLAKFLPDKDSIRKFEDLLRLLNDLIPEDLQTLLDVIEESLIEQGSNRSKINVQNSLIQILSKAVELLESQPKYRPNKKPQLDYIDFHENENVTDKPGRMYWKDNNDKSLNIVMNEDSVTLQVGQEMYYLVKNESGSTINNGSLVKFSGISDNKLVCSLAKGSDNINSIIGIATQDILNNTFGFVTYFGSVKGLNASGSTVSETWNNGNLLYPHPTINGGLTKTRPSAPNFKQPIAVVTDNSSTDGILLVRMTTGAKLTTLHDVEINSVSDGDILQYNATNQRWENISGASGTFITADATPKTVTVTNGIITNIV